jgi:peptide/nickel transport system substrate-binding protein
MTYLNLNNPEVGFLENPDFRRALLAAINRDAIIEQVFNGQAVQANGPILPGTWAHYNDLEKVPFNLVEAKRLFESTGVTFDEEAEVYRSETDLEISLTLMHPDTVEHTQIAEQIQADWEELGVNVTLESKPYENILEDLSLRNYETALVDINFTRSPDPDPYPFWGQAQIQSGQNYAEWDNRSASEFLEQARMTSDIGERERLYRNFQVLFMRELPSLPLFYPVYTYAVTEDINGIKLGPLFEPSDRFNNVHEWYILSGVDMNGENNIEATDSVE